MRQVPILFLSDSVDQKTGLARITRDLCGQLARNPKFRVGSLGLGGNTARSLPWAQYQVNEKKGIWGGVTCRLCGMTSPASNAGS